MSHENPYFRRGRKMSYEKVKKIKTGVTVSVFVKLNVFRSPNNKNIHLYFTRRHRLNGKHCL